MTETNVEFSERRVGTDHIRVRRECYRLALVICNAHRSEPRVGLDHAGTDTSGGFTTLKGNRSLTSASAARCGSSVSTRSR